MLGWYNTKKEALCPWQQSCTTEYPKPGDTRCRSWTVSDNQSLFWNRERDQRAYRQRITLPSLLLSPLSLPPPAPLSPRLGWTTSLTGALSNMAPLLRNRACVVKCLSFGSERPGYQFSSRGFTSYLVWETLETFPPKPLFCHLLDGAPPSR